MTAHDYLAEAERCWATTDAPEDWVNITTRTAALLGIGQQLRRIADAMPQRTPTLDVLGERMDAYSPKAKSYASVLLRKGLDADPWDIEEVWDVVAAAYDTGHLNAEHEVES